MPKANQPDVDVDVTSLNTSQLLKCTHFQLSTKCLATLKENASFRLKIFSICENGLKNIEFRNSISINNLKFF